ncbi:MAG: pyridoxamine 5'-phosphate oxidase family protein [Rikenellaceae bacterium]
MNQNKIDIEITRFIKEHHVMTLATLNGDLPYCANLFYAYSSELQAFVFTSSSSTLHGQNMAANPKVAASIVLETKVVGKVRGLQICGESVLAENDDLERAKKSYLKRFPYAVFADLELWLLRPNFLKLTDNRMGFGKKIVWKDGE